MRNKYRVDVTETLKVPCGMNTVKYIGNSRNQAIKVYERTEPGHKNVLLSYWSEVVKNFVCFKIKGNSFMKAFALYWQDAQEQEHCQLLMAESGEEADLAAEKFTEYEGNGIYRVQEL